MRRLRKSPGQQTRLGTRTLGGQRQRTRAA